MYDAYDENIVISTEESDLVEKCYPATIEISNFTWISETIDWTFVRLLEPFPNARYKDFKLD